MWYRDVASPGRQAGGELQTEGNLHKRHQACLGCLGILWLCQIFKTGEPEGKIEEVQ